MQTTNEGFIVVEIDGAGKPTMRLWILKSDVEARQFATSMYKSFPNYSYNVRRANVANF